MLGMAQSPVAPLWFHADPQHPPPPPILSCFQQGALGWPLTCLGGPCRQSFVLQTGPGRVSALAVGEA